MNEEEQNSEQMAQQLQDCMQEIQRVHIVNEFTKVGKLDNFEGDESKWSEWDFKLLGYMDLLTEFKLKIKQHDEAPNTEPIQETEPSSFGTAPMEVDAFFKGGRNQHDKGDKGGKGKGNQQGKDKTKDSGKTKHTKNKQHTKDQNKGKPPCFEGYCSYAPCGKWGHKKQDCWHYLDDQAKKQKEVSQVDSQNAQHTTSSGQASGPDKSLIKCANCDTQDKHYNMFRSFRLRFRFHEPQSLEAVQTLQNAVSSGAEALAAFEKHLDSLPKDEYNAKYKSKTLKICPRCEVNFRTEEIAANPSLLERDPKYATLEAVNRDIKRDNKGRLWHERARGYTLAQQEVHEMCACSTDRISHKRRRTLQSELTSELTQLVSYPWY